MNTADPGGSEALKLWTGEYSSVRVPEAATQLAARFRQEWEGAAANAVPLARRKIAVRAPHCLCGVTRMRIILNGGVVSPAATRGRKASAKGKGLA